MNMLRISSRLVGLMLLAGSVSAKPKGNGISLDLPNRRFPSLPPPPPRRGVNLTSASKTGSRRPSMAIMKQAAQKQRKFEKHAKQPQTTTNRGIQPVNKQLVIWHGKLEKLDSKFWGVRWNRIRNSEWKSRYGFIERVPVLNFQEGGKGCYLRFTLMKKDKRGNLVASKQAVYTEFEPENGQYPKPFRAVDLSGTLKTDKRTFYLRFETQFDCDDFANAANFSQEFTSQEMINRDIRSIHLAVGGNIQIQKWHGSEKAGNFEQRYVRCGATAKTYRATHTVTTTNGWGWHQETKSNVVVQVPYIPAGQQSPEKIREIREGFARKCEAARWLKNDIPKSDYLLEVVDVSPPRRGNDWIVCKDVGQSLWDYFAQRRDNIGEKEKKQMLFDILRGLQDLHRNGYAYGDLGLDNVSVGPNHKLIDFDMMTKRSNGKWFPLHAEATMQGWIDEPQFTAVQTWADAEKELLDKMPHYFSADLEDIYKLRMIIATDFPEFESTLGKAIHDFENNTGFLPKWKRKIQQTGELPPHQPGQMIVDEIIKHRFFSDLTGFGSIVVD